MTGVQIVSVEIPIPIDSEEEIVELFRKEFEKHKTIKIHIFGMSFLLTVLEHVSVTLDNHSKP